jgi:hypothetical protein
MAIEKHLVIDKKIAASGPREAARSGLVTRGVAVGGYIAPRHVAENELRCAK